MKEEDQQKIQEKYMEFNLISQKIKQIEKHIEAVTSQMMEMVATSQNLEEISGLTAGTEILVPLANGIFASAKIKDTKEMLINVGSDIIVKKSMTDTITFVKKQAEDLRKVHKEYAAELQSLAERAEDIEKELNQLAG